MMIQKTGSVFAMPTSVEVSTLDRQWTSGIERVAALVRKSINYRKTYGMPFSSYSQIARYWSRHLDHSVYHSTLTAYAKGVIEDPRVNGWKVVQYLAPLVFCVNHFDVDKEGKVIDVVIDPMKTYLGIWQELAKITIS